MRTVSNVNKYQRITLTAVNETIQFCNKMYINVSSICKKRNGT